MTNLTSLLCKALSGLVNIHFLDFSKGMEFLRFGNMTDTLSALQSCYQLRTKAMYAHHLEVTEVADQLARCYAMMGSFSESAQYLKVSLPAIQERYHINKYMNSEEEKSP